VPLEEGDGTELRKGLDACLAGWGTALVSTALLAGLVALVWYKLGMLKSEADSD